MSNESIFISEQTIEEIKENCSSIKDSTLRCKAAARVFASNVAKMFFENNELDCESGIHNIPEVISDIEISDVYIRNCYIDVRFYFHSNELCVPVSLFKRNLLPVAFMFIKLSEDLSGAEITGYITPGEIVKSKEIDGYYPVDEASLLSFYDIESLLNADEVYDISPDDMAEVFDFLDNNLDDVDSFYKKLFESKPLRLELIKAASADRKLKSISNRFENVAVESPDNEETSDNNMESPLETAVPSDALPFDTGVDVSDLELQDIEGNLDDLEGEPESLEEFGTDSTLDEFNTDDNLELEEFSDSAENLEIDETQNVELGEFNQQEFSDEEQIQISDYNDITETSEDNTSNDIYSEDDLEFSKDETLNDIEYNEEPDDSTLYSTETTPSLKMYEETEDGNSEPSEDIYDSEGTEEIYDNTVETAEQGQEDVVISDEIGEDEKIQENEDISEEPAIDLPERDDFESDTSDESSEQELGDIDALFSDGSNNEPQENESYNNSEAELSDIEDAEIPHKPKKSIVPIIGLLVLFAALGYIGFTKFVHPNNTQQNVQNITDVDVETPADDEGIPAPAEQPDAMPTETVENVAPDKTKNEGTAVSIPAIEHNLDASVLVSNLSISWEVPAAYTTNNSAKRYFAKIGKIIQMNLKAELLLLSKPPINNRIVLELEYNKSSGNYNIKGFSVSSGEKTIDDVITNTVKNVLNMNLNIDTNSFGNIQGNPMLIIKL